jgi:hypothetical protein
MVSSIKVTLIKLCNSFCPQHINQQGGKEALPTDLPGLRW